MNITKKERSFLSQKHIKAYNDYMETGMNIEAITKKHNIGLNCFREYVSRKLTKTDREIVEFESEIKEPHFIEVTSRIELINGKIVHFMPSLINFD